MVLVLVSYNKSGLLKVRSAVARKQKNKQVIQVLNKTKFSQ